VQAFAAVACAAAAWPAIRAVASRAVWRAYPVFGAELLGALLLCAVTAAVAIVLLPAAGVAAIGACALALALVMGWLGRPSSGRRRGLPPGSLAVLPLGAWTDPNFFLARGPVFKTRQIVRPMVCIVDLAVGRQLLAKHDADLDAPPLAFNRFIPGGFLRWREHGSHAHYKDVFRQAFARDVVIAWEERFRAEMRRTLAATARGAAVDPRAAVNRMLFPLWVRLFVGLDDHRRLKELSRTLDIRRSHRARERRARRAVAEAEDACRSLRPWRGREQS
jgi:hypothetical protein